MQIQIGYSVVLAAAVALFLVVTGYQVWGVLQDTAQALKYRFSLDYGEGIVWQQALLMFGTEMYSPSPNLPFIVFHYPPLFHIVVRAMMALGLDPLFSGRLVSTTASAVSAMAISALIMMGGRQARGLFVIAVAVAIALMFLCLNPVRSWGIYMRVDMLAEALGLAGTVVLVRSRCSTIGTMLALLLCVAAMFTKQTQFPAGISVFVVALVSAPRAALVGAAVAGSIGIACAGILEWETGGFFKNIISYNINPFHVSDALRKLWMEREEAPLVFLMLVTAARIGVNLSRDNIKFALRSRDRQTIAEAVVLCHFLLASLSVIEILKDGGSNNYFIDMLAIGCVLIGLGVSAFSTKPILLSFMIVTLALANANFRHRFLYPERLARTLPESEILVEQIAKSDRPVISDDMVLIMRAGKPLVYEPAIVNVLVAEGKWDPAPLLAMIRDHGFAFALTFSSGGASGSLVTRAIDTAYPAEIIFNQNLTGHYLPAATQ